jgi:hypothetical protein
LEVRGGLLRVALAIPEHCHERLLRDVDVADLAHAALALLPLLEQPALLRAWRTSARREFEARRGQRRALGATVTGNWRVDSFPQESVAVHVTRVVPTGKTLPEGGVHTTVGAGSLASLAVAE